MNPQDKLLIWLHGEVKTPPMTSMARIEAGFLLRQLQQGDTLSLPHSRPMPAIGPHCHELRVRDKQTTWRIIYRIDTDAIAIAEVFAKKTQKTPQHIITICQKRLRRYDDVIQAGN